MTEHSKFFQKYTLNNKVEVPSLLSVAPITLFGSNPDGTISSEERKFFQTRGEGIGLFILGATCVSLEGLAFDNQPRAFNDNDIPSNSERAKIIKSQGALAINQIHHGGNLGLKRLSGVPVCAVSADVINKDLEKKGKLNEETKVVELTEKDIKRIIDDFAKATEISIKAGYDGIEIHGANNYLLQQFFSGYYNQRNDAWGGSLEKRMKFPLEVLDACCKVREKYNKPEFIIGYRLSPEEPFDEGITMTETLELVRALIKRPIQFIHVSQSKFFQEARRGEGKGTPRLKLIHDEIKGKVALIGVGGLYTYDDLLKALNSGYADFIGVARALMLNKNLGKILKEGKIDEIITEIDPEKPEKYDIPKMLWDMCVQKGSWLNFKIKEK